MDSTDRTVESALSQWANAVESAVDKALQTSGCSEGPNHLPPAFRGRCQRPAYRQIQPAPVPKFANNRTYEPLVDIVSFTVVHKTRQVRRLYSYRRTLSSFFGPHKNPPHFEQLKHLWNSIRVAKGYSPDFPTWCQQTTGAWYIDCTSPGSIQWIDDLIIHARTDCDQFASKSRTMRTQDLKTKLEVDWGKHGGKFTAMLLRKPAYAAANHMTSTTEYQCTRLRSTHKQEPRIRMHGGNVAVGEVLIIGGEKCRILAKNTADVCVLDALPRTSASFMAQQHPLMLQSIASCKCGSPCGRETLRRKETKKISGPMPSASLSSLHRSYRKLRYLPSP